MRSPTWPRQGYLDSKARYDEDMRDAPSSSSYEDSYQTMGTTN